METNNDLNAQNEQLVKDLAKFFNAKKNNGVVVDIKDNNLSLSYKSDGDGKLIEIQTN